MGYMNKLILNEKQRENLKGLVEKIKSVMPLNLYPDRVGFIGDRNSDSIRDRADETL